MVCTKCGKSLDDSASFCGGCGTNLKELYGDYEPAKKVKQAKKSPFKFKLISREQMDLLKNKVKKALILCAVVVVIGSVVVIALRSNSDFDFKVDNEILTDYNGKNYAIYTPEKATVIGEWSFSDKRTIKTITVNEAVTKIGHGAFEGCTSLTMITIPESVTEIGDWILAECWSLTTVCVKAGSYADAWAKTYNFHSNVTIEYY